MNFSFGGNWARYSALLDEPRIAEATRSLQDLLCRDRLVGLSFFDVGCGSGLFSIAAARLGATPILAIDPDHRCVEITRRNVEAFLEGRKLETISVEPGDILRPEREWTGRFDVVYAWGSLHHTGAMWQAIENAAQCCRADGSLVIAVYNHTVLSPAWLRIKRIYRATPRWVAWTMVAAIWGVRCCIRLLRSKHPFRAERAMSVWYDAVDWLGGLPYEYARAERVAGFIAGLGFRVVRSVTTRRSGCNEFVFRRVG